MATKLTRDNAAVLMIDHQMGLVVGSRFPDPDTLARNSVGLVGAAKLLGIPVIATTTGKALFGPFIPELAAALGDTDIHERALVDPFDKNMTATIRATGRTHLIVAGVSLAVCACVSAISAAALGLRTYVAIDACAAFDDLELQTSLHRLTQAGVTVNTYGAMIVEMVTDNADPQAREMGQVDRLRRDCHGVRDRTDRSPCHRLRRRPPVLAAVEQGTSRPVRSEAQSNI